MDTQIAATPHSVAPDIAVRLDIRADADAGAGLTIGVCPLLPTPDIAFTAARHVAIDADELGRGLLLSAIRRLALLARLATIATPAAAVTPFAAFAPFPLRRILRARGGRDRD